MRLIITVFREWFRYSPFFCFCLADCLTCTSTLCFFPSLRMQAKLIAPYEFADDIRKMFNRLDCVNPATITAVMLSTKQ